MSKPKLDDLIRDTKREKPPEPDWKSIDEKLFARLEQEPRTANVGAPNERDTDEREERSDRVVWIGAAISLAAAAAALVMLHPARDGALQTSSPQVAALSDRIDVGEHVAYFESKNASGETAVRWSAQPGSALHVEHAASPLVLSLEKGVAEAQVTPVPSGEAFAIDVTSSSGEVVRVAVHGTHLRVAREGDKVVVDLTEGVVSIGAPPRRGSTIGTLVTAPAHVELDARDLASLRVAHESSAIRAAERVTAPEITSQTASLAIAPTLNTALDTASGTTPDTLDIEASRAAHAQTPSQQTQQVVRPSGTVAVGVTNTQPAWLTTQDDLANALAQCGKDSVAPQQTTFATTLTLQIADDGSVQNARFNPPLPPEARDCAANVIYRRAKLQSVGWVDVAVKMTR